MYIFKSFIFIVLIVIFYPFLLSFIFTCNGSIIFYILKRELWPKAQQSSTLIYVDLKLSEVLELSLFQKLLHICHISLISVKNSLKKYS